MRDGTLISFLQRLIARPEFGPFVLLIGEIVAFTMRSPAFLSAGNISNSLAFTPELGMIALGMTLLMISGEFDLSVGSVFGFAPIVMWTFYNAHISSLEVGFLIAMAIAAVIGFVNGWLVTRLKIPSFLVTLGMLLVVRGTALYITSGFPQRTWAANSPLMAIIVGEFSIGELRIHTSLLCADPVQSWELDSGGGWQPGSRPCARRTRFAYQDFAVYLDGSPFRLRRCDQLDSSFSGQPKQWHPIRAGGDRYGGNRRYRAYRRSWHDHRHSHRRADPAHDA
jgi:hypothetical protein